MTTYGEAFQMGIGANVAVSVLNEINCAGDALSEKTLEVAIDPNVPQEVKEMLVHVLHHLSVVRELTEAYDGFVSEAIHNFGDENPGKLYNISKEISEYPLIIQMQDIMGMSQEQRLAKIKRNLDALQAENN